MKVYIIDEQIEKMGGVERIVNTLANNLVEKYNVEIVSEIKTEQKNFFDYNNKININYLINDVSKIKLNYVLKKIRERIKRRILLESKIDSFLNRINKDDVIIFGRVSVALHFLPVMEKRKLFNKIIVRDGTNIYCYGEKVKEKIKKYFPNNVNYFVISSDESKRKYDEFFKEGKMKIVKIYNPLGIVPKQEYKYSNKSIIAVGRICTQKGFDNLIEAFSLIEKKYKDWNVFIYGNGEKEHQLQDLIKKLNLENRVFILPQNKNIVEVYNSASIYVSTSRYEGYANSLVEAATCGVPIISYNWLTGVEEIIKENENGFIVNLKDRMSYFNGINNKEDVENLANALEKLMDNEKLCNQFSKSNAEILRSRSIENVIKEWDNMIQN